MLDDFLALARAEAGGATLGQQPCDLARLTIEVVQDAVPSAIERHIDLGYDGMDASIPALTIPGNPTLLKEMIRNMVDNAIKYAPSSMEHAGVITARVIQDPASRAPVIQVEDNGPGIPAEERGRVFEPFYRVLGTNVDGTGLGLPIVREIASQHGAEVNVHDARPGEQRPGACFEVRFGVV